MKCIVLKKRSIIIVFSIIVTASIVMTLFSSLDAKPVMSAAYNMPITGIKTDDKQVALSINVYENTDIDSILELLGDTKATFFVSEAFDNLRGVKVSQIASLGHDVGILEDNMRGKTRKEINDRLAERVERLSFLAGKPCDLIRFNNNGFDSGCIDAVFSLGLYPVQWSTDDSVGSYSQGDIILVSEENKAGEFIKKLTADGFRIETVDGIILKRNYTIDSGGEQRLLITE